MAFQILGTDFDNIFEPVRSGATTSTFTGLTTTTGSTTKNVEYMALTGTAVNPNKDGYWKHNNSPYSALGKGVKIPKSLTVNGSWTNPQRGGQAPDTAGLTYTVTYYNGTTATVNATFISPSTWDNVSVPTTKYATFQYTENGISVTASKAATVYEYYQGTPLTLKFTANGTITISNAPSGNMWYSINNGSKTALPATGVISVTTNNEVRLWANRSSASSDAPLQISCDTNSKFYIYGNIMSLISASADFAGLTSIGFNYVFYRLFFNSSKLDISSSRGRLVLPATTLAKNCYAYMFGYCTSLTTAPELPATSLAENCYENMFVDCTSLTTAPATLPATTLAPNCYNYMFAVCTSLTTAPALPATTLVTNCYNGMFRGCSSLNSITCYAEDISASSCTSNWVQGVATSGTFTGNSMTNWTIGVSGIPAGWVRRDPYQDIPLTFELTAAGTITVTNPPSENMWYSINEGNRVAYSAAFSANAGDKVSFYTNRRASGSSSSSTFQISCNTSSKFYAYGNVMSLISADDFEDSTRLPYENTFSLLFEDNTQLVISPSRGRLVLPATSLADGCYRFMFRGCTSLTTAPVLPATTLAEGCYQYMFYNCTSLTTAPELPATTLTEECYYAMFWNCTSLTTAPVLPATTLARFCYTSMFNGCTSLTTAPALPVTTLKDYCYGSMFSGCTSLTTAPALPATSLADNCYSGMFQNCTSLTTAPELPATILVFSCYSRMFNGCTSLNSITCYAEDISASGCTTNWVQNVAASGTFMTNLSTQWTIGNNGIPTGWTKRTPNQEDPLTFELTAAGTITVANPPSGNMWYSINGGSRTAYSAAFSVNAGDKVRFYANRSSADPTSGAEFKISCDTSSKFYAYGNVMSLISADNFENLTSIGFEYAFYQLFRGNTQLDISSSRGRLVLPATTLASYCYRFMFYLCSSLATAPELPATTLASYCYYYMFSNCTSLTTAPKLPATTLITHCYDGMFATCSSLTTAPKLPATTLASYCYIGMFNTCTSLTTAPALPATKLENYCYNSMFNGCTSLTTAPALPATKLATGCYQYMFKSCSLTAAPALPATTLAGGCYVNMFSSCTSLTTAPALPATSLEQSCYESMFNGCTSLTTAPALPATTLKQSCYESMFKSCTSLTTAPTLPATSLVRECYEYMFSGCTSLNSITCYATSISATWCTDDWMEGVAASGTFRTPSSTAWKTGVDGIPSGWTRVNI